MKNPFSKPGHPDFLGRAIAAISWLILLGILIHAAGLRSAIPPVPLAEHDTWGWLGSALGWLSGLGFREVFEREWLYGAFLAGCLKWVGSFSGIVIIQQALGLVGGALAFLTWRVWLGILKPLPVWNVVATAVGVAVVWLNLNDTHLLNLEISLRPEAILMPVAYAQLACISLFSYLWWTAPRRALAVVFGAMAVPLAYALYVLKPNWALAVPLTLLPLGLALIDWQKRSVDIRGLLAPVAGGLLALACVWLPGKLMFEKPGQKRLVLPMTLLTIHADVILKSLRSAPPPHLPEGTIDLLEKEFETAKTQNRYYRRLGFDPDYIMYRSQLFPWLEHQHGYTREQIASFCIDSYLQAWRTHPVDMTGKIFNQFEHFLRPDEATFTRKRLELGKYYAHSDSLYPRTLGEEHSPAVAAAFAVWRDQTTEATAVDTRLQAPRRVHDIRRSFPQLMPWITGLFLLVLVACFCRKDWHPLLLPGLMVLVFWFAPAGNALTVAVAHALDNSRYRISYGGLLVFAGAAMVVFLGDVILRTVVARFRR
ncbi:MAG: hypothetical protein WEB60_07845 [Terrimicrobiaceae bacterium]